jgi:flagellar basal-body rod protein FlgB
MPLNTVGLELGSFLTYLARRQEVIASNIANADTPGYRSLDLAPPHEKPSGFSRIFQDSLSESMPAGAEETPGLTTRNDGNNVSMDREARVLAENTMKFNIAAQMLRGEIKGIRSAIEEGRAS